MHLEITRVADGSGAEFACSRTHCGARPRPPSFIELAPGDQFSRRLELGCDYALRDEGPWRIVARYHDESEGPRIDENAEYWTWFNGQLESNSIEISVKPWDEVWDTWHEELRQRQQEDEERRRQQ